MSLPCSGRGLMLQGREVRAQGAQQRTSHNNTISPFSVPLCTVLFPLVQKFHDNQEQHLYNFTGDLRCFYSCCTYIIFLLVEDMMMFR